jgi:hypothetical protein
VRWLVLLAVAVAFAWVPITAVTGAVRPRLAAPTAVVGAVLALIATLLAWTTGAPALTLDWIPSWASPRIARGLVVALAVVVLGLGLWPGPLVAVTDLAGRSQTRIPEAPR